MTNKILLEPGYKYGRWTVLFRGPNTKYQHVRMWCVCDCGVVGLIPAASLRGKSHASRSCGCYERDVNAMRREAGIRRRAEIRAQATLKEWNDDFDNTLIDGLEAGLSFTKIGKLIGATKGQVAGRAWRFGYCESKRMKWIRSGFRGVSP